MSDVSPCSLSALKSSRGNVHISVNTASPYCIQSTYQVISVKSTVAVLLITAVCLYSQAMRTVALRLLEVPRWLQATQRHQ